MLRILNNGKYTDSKENDNSYLQKRPTKQKQTKSAEINNFANQRLDGLNSPPQHFLGLECLLHCIRTPVTPMPTAKSDHFEIGHPFESEWLTVCLYTLLNQTRL